MCCILYIPKGVSPPNANTFNRIFECNRDGIGYVDDNENSRIMYSLSELFVMLEQAGDTIGRLIHFRNATRGIVCNENCQPFYDQSTKIWFAHNGTLHNMQVDATRSDSNIFFYEKFVPVASKYGRDSNELWNFVKDNIERSRFIFMKSGEYKMFAGDPSFKDWTCINGIYYSRTYKTFKFE